MSAGRVAGQRMPEKYYTPAEIAEILQVSERFVRELCARYEMPHSRLGRRGIYRISEADLNEYLKRVRRTAV